MRIIIENFKSIEHVELELAPLTILLGPPASGKSNILDAIAILGYFNRFLVMGKEYEKSVSYLEPISIVARFKDNKQLFRYGDLTKSIIIKKADNSMSRVLEVRMYFDKARFNLTINGKSIYWDLMSLNGRKGIVSTIINSLKAIGRQYFIEARLYGYDRYGLASLTCESIYSCGFPIRLLGRTFIEYPRNILSELGWNVTSLTKSVVDVILRLNRLTVDAIGEKIEIKVLRDGKIAIFDYHIEVDADSVSDSLFRILYYLIALRTASNYAKIHGLEKRLIILLEEPEAHTFPFFMNLLVEYIEKAIQVAYVVVATHNPLLVSTLWDKIKDVKTYYVTRDELGSTNVAEIDVGKMAEDMKTVDEILFMPPREVIEKYTAGNKE